MHCRTGICNWPRTSGASLHAAPHPGNAKASPFSLLRPHEADNVVEHVAAPAERPRQRKDDADMTETLTSEVDRILQTQVAGG